MFESSQTSEWSWNNISMYWSCEYRFMPSWVSLSDFGKGGKGLLAIKYSKGENAGKSF